MMMERIDEMIERYFEATLSEEEETALKAFMASPEGQAPEYDEVRAVMGYFATGRSLNLSKGRWPGSFGRLRNRTRRLIAVAASLAILVTLGVNLYNKSNICVSIVDGKRITDKEVVMNDVDNILADVLSDRTGMEEQLSDIFGK
jgi:hypothetical protein